MKLNPISFFRRSRAKSAGATAVALLALAAFAGSAQACSYSGAEQVFKPWGDQHSYVLAPDGGFESGGAGWSLNGGAKAVNGNESYNAGRRPRRTLAVAAGRQLGGQPVDLHGDRHAGVQDVRPQHGRSVLAAAG